MWSKTKKALESRLADGLKNRVYYTFANHTYYYNGSAGGDFEFYPLFYIRVDKKTWFVTNVKWTEKVSEYEKITHDYEKAVNIATKEMGTLDMFGYGDYLMKMVHNYLNVYTIEECLNHDNYFYKILAVLDRRTGKRKIKALLDNIDNEPEWFRKYITLRANAENIHINSKQIKEESNESTFNQRKSALTGEYIHCPCGNAENLP